MKKLNEIVSAIKFPQIKDVLGKEIRPGDVVAIPSSYGRRIDTMIVTGEFTKTRTGSLMFISLDKREDSADEYISYIDIKNLLATNKWDHGKIELVRITETIDSITLAEIKTRLENFHNDIFAKQHHKNSVQLRCIPMFAYNRTENTFFVMMPKIMSELGKVINQKNIADKLTDLHNKYSDRFDLWYMTKDDQLCQVNPKSQNTGKKIVLYSSNDISQYKCEQTKTGICGVNGWNLKYSYDMISDIDENQFETMRQIKKSTKTDNVIDPSNWYKNPFDYSNSDYIIPAKVSNDYYQISEVLSMDVLKKFKSLVKFYNN